LKHGKYICTLASAESIHGSSDKAEYSMGGSSTWYHPLSDTTIPLVKIQIYKFLNISKSIGMFTKRVFTISEIFMTKLEININKQRRQVQHKLCHKKKKA
jgi:hypothetical protein